MNKLKNKVFIFYVYFTWHASLPLSLHARTPEIISNFVQDFFSLPDFGPHPYEKRARN